jgi:hypothetical protein
MGATFQFIPLRRRVALLGIFAILLQAALFAWHHHPLLLSSHGAPAILASGPSGSHSTPILTDDDCQICFALSHLAATPVAFATTQMPGPVPLHLAAAETIWVPVRPYVLFRSRAPPRA